MGVCVCVCVCACACLSVACVVCVLYSGVFQSLVEKHFPAPDRRKMFDLFTVGSSSSRGLFDDSPVPSPGSVASVKRKLDASGTFFCIVILLHSQRLSRGQGMAA